MSINEMPTLSHFEKELAIVFMGISFINMYLNDIEEKGEDLKNYEKPIRLMKRLQNIARLYHHKSDKIANATIPLLNEVETENKKIKPLKRFEKRVRFSGEDLEVNGLLFGVSMLLEHLNIPNRKLRLDYRLIKDIYMSFEDRHSKNIDNSRVLSTKIVDKLKG